MESCPESKRSKRLEKLTWVGLAAVPLPNVVEMFTEAFLSPQAEQSLTLAGLGVSLGGMATMVGSIIAAHRTEGRAPESAPPEVISDIVPPRRR